MCECCLKLTIAEIDENENNSFLFYLQKRLHVRQIIRKKSTDSNRERRFSFRNNENMQTQHKRRPSSSITLIWNGGALQHKKLVLLVKVIILSLNER